jgi:cytochrome b6-f complex iron-sulfur subunit
MTDPRDLAEAARRAGAAKAKAAQAEKAPSKPATPRKAEVKVVPPRPGREEKEAALAIARAERRGFLIGSILVSWVVLGWTTFVAGMTALTLACVRFMFPNVLAEPPSTIKVGLPSNFEKEEVNERWKAEWGFWIVRSSYYDGQDKVYALSSTCTHLGCPPNWLGGEQKFKCPCHGSGFYISGVNFEGPAPRPLERFKVSLADDGQIIVDKSQKFQEELKQWVEPDSFIQV